MLLLTGWNLALGSKPAPWIQVLGVGRCEWHGTEDLRGSNQSRVQTRGGASLLHQAVFSQPEE